MNSKMVDNKDSPYESDEQRGGHYFDLTDTFRSLKEEIRSCKANNDMIIQAQEKHREINAILL